MKGGSGCGLCRCGRIAGGCRRQEGAERTRDNDNNRMESKMGDCGGGGGSGVYVRAAAGCCGTGVVVLILI